MVCKSEIFIFSPPYQYFSGPLTDKEIISNKNRSKRFKLFRLTQPIK
uniref:Uncharacterized protein n=1 Tax=Siphoviridae sp. ctJhT5 TaxID=2826242 RepID=A0A8S5R017_9CAUD|nr:MAG TPA: hypothetical protein [Siphoviridae sp. ctJhT5]